MNPITLEQINQQIAEFNEKFPRPNLDPLVLSELVDVKDRNAQWPHAGNPGVYLLFDDAKILLYIGKASCNSALGYRLRAYFNKFGEAKHPAYSGVRYLATIRFPLDRGFEAPSTEEFLIARLNPPLCGIGRSQPVAMNDSVETENLGTKIGGR